MQSTDPPKDLGLVWVKPPEAASDRASLGRDKHLEVVKLLLDFIEGLSAEERVLQLELLRFTLMMFSGAAGRGGLVLEDTLICLRRGHQVADSPEFRRLAEVYSTPLT